MSDPWIIRWTIAILLMSAVCGAAGAIMGGLS